MNIGILALQGAFIEHAAMLEHLGIAHFEIRQLHDLNQPLDGLILPGGESTTMAKLLHDLNLFTPLQTAIRTGLPVLGTCAGLILLAAQVEGGKPCFGTMDICARRNAYGRQLGSFHVRENFQGIGQIPMTFIRAPYIKAIGNKANGLAQVNGRIVAARQDNQLVTAFHPELDKSPAVHEYFLDIVQGFMQKAVS